MKKLVILLLVSLMATSAFATIDPDPDMLGVYFDLDAEDNCLEGVGPFVQFGAYVVITNPSAPEVHGLEFGYTINTSDPSVFRLLNALPPGAVDLGDSSDWATGDYVVGLATPLLSSTAVVFVEWQFLLQVAEISMEFYLGPSVVESIADGLPAYEIGGSILPLGLSTGGVEYAVATVNTGICVVANEVESFGSVKSLFR